MLLEMQTAWGSSFQAHGLVTEKIRSPNFINVWSTRNWPELHEAIDATEVSDVSQSESI